MKKQFRYYDLILAVFASMLLISNLAATKLLAFGHIIADGGGVMFPLVYIFDDILTEVYGFKYSRRAIWTGFSVMLMAIFVFTVVRYLPGAREYHDQASYDAVLGFFPQIVIASLVAYLVGEFMNSFILAKLKIKFNGRQLWLRLVSSTFVGELFDTTIFAFIAFGTVLHGWDMFGYIMAGWLFKCAVEVIFLPVTYRVVNFLKKREGVDAYDRKTNFSPFRISVND